MPSPGLLRAGKRSLGGAGAPRPCQPPSTSACRRRRAHCRSAPLPARSALAACSGGERGSAEADAARRAGDVAGVGSGLEGLRRRCAVRRRAEHLADRSDSHRFGTIASRQPWLERPSVFRRRARAAARRPKRAIDAERRLARDPARVEANIHRLVRIELSALPDPIV